MGEFRRIDDRISVSPQISIADVAAARDAGFVSIINNRPDGEAPDEPQSVDIAQAAADAGLAYYVIPVGHAGFTQDQATALAAALAEADGPVLAYCRSGTRSCFLWAMNEALAGGDPAEIAAKAREAGYEVAPLLHQLGAR